MSTFAGCLVAWAASSSLRIYDFAAQFSETFVSPGRLVTCMLFLGAGSMRNEARCAIQAQIPVF